MRVPLVHGIGLTWELLKPQRIKITSGAGPHDHFASRLAICEQLLGSNSESLRGENQQGIGAAVVGHRRVRFPLSNNGQLPVFIAPPNTLTIPAVISFLPWHGSHCLSPLRPCEGCFTLR
jgi:hypothetical protein